MHAVARPPLSHHIHRDDSASASVASSYPSRESSMYPEQQNVNGWTVIREPRHQSGSDYSEDGDGAEMDVDSRDYHHQQWYRQNREPSHPMPDSRNTYPDMGKYAQQQHQQQHQQHGQYGLAPLSSSARRSPTLPVHLSLPIPPSLPFPSSKSPVSAPPHITDPHSHQTLLHPYHPASAHPSHSHEYEQAREFGGPGRHPKLPPPSALESYRDLPPISPTSDGLGHSPSLSAALASSKLVHGHALSGPGSSLHGLSKSAPVPPPSLPPTVRLAPSQRQSTSHAVSRGSGANDPSMDAMAQKQIVYTDDATTKLGSYIRRRCYNCHTPDSAAWRRSGMHPGKVLCNKCGLYERTHQKDRPHDPAELRSKPRKALHQKLAGPGVPSSPVDALSRSRHSPGGMSPVLRSPIERDRERDMDRPVRMDTVPPRPLNTHASLLHMQTQSHGQSPGGVSPADEMMRDETRQGGFAYAQKDTSGVGNARGGPSHPHSLGSLLNHPPLHQQQHHSRSHSPASAAGSSSHPRESPRGNIKQLHLSPVMAQAPQGYSTQARSSASSPHSVIDVDKEYLYDDKAGRSPHSAREQEKLPERKRES